MTKNKRFISFGITSPNDVVIDDIRCSLGLKPTGCICAYERLKDEKYMANYEYWCDQEGIERGLLRYGITYTLSENKRIYRIEGWADFFKLIKKFPLLKRATNSNLIVDIGIDYNAMAKKYDGIWFTNKALSNTDLQEPSEIDIFPILTSKFPKSGYYVNGRIKLNTAGWEVPCICIFNPKIIENVEYFEGTSSYIYDRNEMYDAVMRELEFGKDEEKIFELLQRYYSGNLHALIAFVKEKKKNDDRYMNLIKRMEGLIELQKSGCMDLRHELDATANDIYKISSDKGDAETFSKDIQKTLMKISSPKEDKIDNTTGGMQTAEDAIAEAFNGLV